MKTDYGNQYNDITMRNEEQLHAVNDTKQHLPPIEGNDMPPLTPERTAYNHRPNAVVRAQKVSSAINTALVALVSVVAAVILGVVGLDAIDFGGKYNGTLELYVGKNYVSYTFFYDQADNNEPYDETDDDQPQYLTVTISNDFTKRQKQLEVYGRGAEGFEEDLAENMQYTIEVRDGSKLLARQTFRTQTQYSLDCSVEGNTARIYLGASDDDEASYVATLTGDIERKTEIRLFENYTFEDLTPNTKYTLTVTLDGKTVATKTFTTTANRQEPAVTVTVTPADTFVTYTVSATDPDPDVMYIVIIYGVTGEAARGEAVANEASELGGLVPETDYRLVVQDDDGNVIAERNFTTASEQQ